MYTFGPGSETALQNMYVHRPSFFFLQQGCAALQLELACGLILALLALGHKGQFAQLINTGNTSEISLEIGDMHCHDKSGIHAKIARQARLEEGGAEQSWLLPLMTHRRTCSSSRVRFPCLPYIKEQRLPL